MADIETLKKMTGWDDAKLAAFITECANEGMNEDQIIDTISQQKSTELGLDNLNKEPEYTMPTVGEMIAEGGIKKETTPIKGLVTPEDNGWTDLKKLGLWIKDNANADEERNAAARKAVANSVNNWRDNHDEQWRTAMISAIFGDNSLLKDYYSDQKAKSEAQKDRELKAEIARLDRESQYAYNSLWKSIEKAKIKKDKYNDAEQEFAKLMQKSERSVAEDKRINQLLKAYPELNESGVKEAVEAAAAEEKKRLSEANREYADLKYKASKLKTADEKYALATKIRNGELTEFMEQEELDDLGNEVQGIDTIGEQVKKATEGAVASHAGQKTSDRLKASDIKAQADDAIRNSTKPSSLKKDVKDEIRKTHRWNGEAWKKQN